MAKAEKSKKSNKDSKAGKAKSLNKKFNNTKVSKVEGQKDRGNEKKGKDLEKQASSLFINRELSWLAFNERILWEARDNQIPLLERLSFLAITESNQDEFVMVRIASLKDQVEEKDYSLDIQGLTAKEQLKEISKKLHEFIPQQYSTYNRQLLPRLEKEGIHILPMKDLLEEQEEYVKRYFTSTLYPILTPMAVDQGRPFPLIPTRSINIAVLLENKSQEDHALRFATIQVPSGVNRLVKLPVKTFAQKHGYEEFTTHCYVLLEDVINFYLEDLFPNLRIVTRCNYRVLRNSVMEIDETDTPDLLSEIEKQLRQRKWGEVIHLAVEEDVSPMLLSRLQEMMKVEDADVYKATGPLDLGFLGKLSRAEDLLYRKDLHYPNYQAQVPAMLRDLQGKGESIFEAIRKKDIFLSLPYESFDPVLAFVREAARDPKVLAIKQTLYRVSGNSPIISYLEEAARNGKQVLVLLELKARFDEENNIQWAKRLEQAGCHVIYGLVGLKTHSKITLVVREEEDGIRRYLHLGTGNYNDTTAKIYTDLGIFTSADAFGVDASEFFNMITGYSEPAHWNRLTIAPLHLRKRFVDLIDREIRNAKEGATSYIHAKMNSLVDKEIIEKLYEASQAGVAVELIVRGISCLRVAIPGVSENIRLRSITGRYLEHSRVYIFANAGKEEIYLSSADWMPRNLDRRVELLFPIEDPECKSRIKEIMQLQFDDTERSNFMQEDGTYKKVDRRGKQVLDCQSAQEDLAIRRALQYQYFENEKRFYPVLSPEENARAFTENVLEESVDSFLD